MLQCVSAAALSLVGRKIQTTKHEEVSEDYPEHREQTRGERETHGTHGAVRFRGTLIEFLMIQRCLTVGLPYILASYSLHHSSFLFNPVMTRRTR